MLNDRIFKEFSFKEEVLFTCDFNSTIENHSFFFNFKSCLPNSTLLLVKWIKINNYKYKCNMTLRLGVQDVLSSFGTITAMTVDENDEFYFIIEKLKTLGFSSHFYAYEVITTGHFLLLKSQDVCAFSSSSLVKKVADGNLYVVYD